MARRLRPLNRAINQIIMHKQKVAQIGQNLGGGMMAYKQGGGAANLPVFDMALTTSITEGVAGGSLLDEFTRAGSGAIVNDFEGNHWAARADEARFYGARRVENQYAVKGDGSGATGTSEGLVGSDWTAIFSASIVDANTIEFGTNAASRVVANFGATIPPHTYTLSCTVWVDSGSEEFRIDIDNSPSSNITVTTTPTRVKFTATAAIGSAYGFRNGTVSPPAAWQMHVTDIQLEDVSGQRNQNPAEYVSAGVGTGAEESLDPEFNNASLWFLPAGATISGGVLTLTSAAFGNVFLSPTPPAIIGRLYAVKVVINQDSGVAAQCAINFGGQLTWQSADGAGTFYYVVRATTIANVTIQCLFPNPDIVIESVSAKEIDHGSNVDGVKYFPYSNPHFDNPALSAVEVEKFPGPETNIQPNSDMSISDSTTSGADNPGWQWSGLATWEIANGKATHVGAAFGSISSKQTFPFSRAIVGVVYRVRYTISDAAVFQVSFALATTDIYGNTLATTPGTYEYYISTIVNNQGLLSFIATGSAGTGASIDNVSIVPVWNIPEDDIKGVQIERASTNYMTRQDMNNGTNWSTTNCTIAVSSVLGDVQLYELNEGIAAGQHFINPTLANQPAIVASQNFCCQWIVEYDNMQYIKVEAVTNTSAALGSVVFDLVNGTIGTAVNATGFMVDVAPGIYRIGFKMASGVGDTSARTRLYGMNSAGTSDNYAGTNRRVRAGAWQLEQAQFPSSYIPTSIGATVSRAGDVLLYNMPSVFTQGPLEGYVISGEIGFIDEPINAIYSTLVSPEVAEMFDNTTANDNYPLYSPFVSSPVGRTAHQSTVVSAIGSTALTKGQHKLALRYNSDLVGATVAIWLNGSSDGTANQLVDPDFSVNPPALININNTASLVGQNLFPVKNIKIFNGKLSDSDMVALQS